MDNIIIKKELGRGMFGTTYLVIRGTKSYALKRQKILKKDLTSTKSSIVRELLFYKWISGLGKDAIFFAKLRAHKVYDSCTFIQIPIHEPFSDKMRTHLENLNKSPYCIDLLIDLKKDNIRNLVFSNKLPFTQRYSLIIQTIYAIYLMRTNKYTHSDVHLGNIAYTICPSTKRIRILSHLVPTFGKIYSLIDYGLVQHKSFDMEKNRIKSYEIKLKYNFDLLIFTNSLIVNGQYIFSELAKQNVKFPKLEEIINITYREFPHLWTQTKEKILNNYPSDPYITKWFKTFNKVHSHPDKRHTIMIFLFNNWLAYLDKKTYCQICGSPFIPNFINDQHVEYILTHHNNMKLILKYFIELVRE